MFLAAAAAETAADGTGRDMLFTNPVAELPDVYISESVLFLEEGVSAFYTVQLTHQPGVREDETVDLMNDEVRIYLTSSQEVYQQDDGAGEPKPFAERIGHRTQLVIDTNVKSSTVDTDAGTKTVKTAAGAGMGPVPYVYVAYSTKNPTQASPTFGAAGSEKYQVVCPVCTHGAFCTQHGSNVIAGTALTDAESFSGEAFDGCLQLTYKGYAPMYDGCSSVPFVYTGYSYTRPEGTYTESVCISNGGEVGAVRLKHCYKIGSTAGLSIFELSLAPRLKHNVRGNTR